MIDRKLIIGLIVLAAIALIVSVTTIVGFFIGDLQLVLNSSKVLSMSTLVLLTVFFRSVYHEMFHSQEENVHEVKMELKTKEDVEEFRRKLEKELQKYIKEIAEEEELDKDKDE